MILLVLGALLILTALLTIYYWVDFFRHGNVQISKEEWYLKFEKAFPVADFWMAGCSLIGGIGLLTSQSYGFLFALLAASSFIFLALMDITFNVQNQLYRLIKTSREMLLELVINVWCLALGSTLILVLSPVLL